MPRLIGFLCNQGLYCCVVCDMISDLSTDWDDAIWDKEGMMIEPDGTDRRKLIAQNQFPEAIMKSCEQQCNRPMFFKVIDNVIELSVMFLYCNVFAMPFPWAPLMFVLNNVFEFHADLYRMFDRRRAIPVASAGLACVWHYIFEGIIYMSVMLNMGWCAYHTNMCAIISGLPDNTSCTSEGNLLFFTVSTGSIMFVLMILQLCIEDKPDDVDDHLSRQRKVELRMVSRAGTIHHAKNIIDNLKEIAKLNDDNKERIRSEVEMYKTDEETAKTAAQTPA